MELQQTIDIARAPISDGSVQRRYCHHLETQLHEDAERIDAWLHGAIEGKVVAFPRAGIA
jgi:hypothetical protein